MAQQRLQITIGADSSPFDQALNRLVAQSKSGGINIAKNLTEGGAGATALESAVEEAANSFSGLSDKAEGELSQVEKASVQAGAKIDSAFDGVDVSSVTAEVKSLEQAIESAGSAAESLDDVADALDDIESAADDAGESLEKAFRAQSLGDFAGRVSEAGKQVGDFFSDAAEDARNIDRELKKAFNNPQELATFQKLVGGIKAEFGDLADSQGLIEATKTLKNFGIANETELKRVINIANATGRSYQEIAERQGEFFASASGGQVNVQALNEYRKVIGAGAVDLKKFGVQVDDNNNIVAKTPAEIKKAQDALRKYIDENDRFSGVLERAQDNQDKLKAQVDFLNESIGVQVNEFKNAVAGGLLPYVKGLNNVSDTTKKFIGLSIAGGSAIAQYGGKAVEFAAHAKAAGLSVAGFTGAVKTATTAVRAFVVGTGGMAAGLAIAAVGLFAITKSALDYADALDQAEKAEQKLAATQSKVTIAYKDRIAKVKESTDALREEYAAIEDFGQRRATIAKDILLRESAAADARAAGNDKLAGQLEAEVRILRSARSEYDLQAATVQEAEKKKQAAIEQSEKAFKKAEEARAKAREEQKKKDEEAAQRRLELDKQYAEESLNLERAAIQQRASLAADPPELDGLERRLSAGEDVIDQIKRESKAQTEKLKGYIEEEAAIERIAIAREKAAQIAEDPQGKDKIAAQAAERERQLNTQVKADKEKLDRELANKLADLDEKRAQLLEKQAKDREAKLKSQAEQESKIASLRLQVLEEELAGQEEVFQQRRRHLDELAAAGQNVAEQQKALVQEEIAAQEEGIRKRLELQKQEIAAKQSQEDVGATKEQKALNAKQASLEIDRAQRQARQELQSIIDQDTEKLRTQTAELEKQRDVLKEQNEERKKAAGFKIDSSFGGVGGVESLGAGFGEGFGERRQPKTEDGQTVEDIDRQITRNKIRLRENEEKTRSQSSKETQSQSDRPRSPAQESSQAPAPASVQLDPNVVALFQQMLSAIQQTAQNTARAARQSTDSARTTSAEQYAKSQGATYY